LGQLKNLMQFQSLPQLMMKRRLADGTVITVGSIHGQDFIRIDPSFDEGDMSLLLAGFLCLPQSDLFSFDTHRVFGVAGNWSAQPLPGYVYGNVDWRGPEGLVLSWHGPRGRYFGPFSGSLNIYHQGRVLAQAPSAALHAYLGSSPKVAGAAVADFAGERYLTVIVTDRSPGLSALARVNTYVFQRRFSESYPNNDGYDADTNPLGWVFLGSLPYVSDTDRVGQDFWFFNQSGTEAQSAGRKRRHPTNEFHGWQSLRTKVSIGFNQASFETLLEGHITLAGEVTASSNSITPIGDWQIVYEAYVWHTAAAHEGIPTGTGTVETFEEAWEIVSEHTDTYYPSAWDKWQEIEGLPAPIADGYPEPPPQGYVWYNLFTGFATHSQIRKVIRIDLEYVRNTYVEDTCWFIGTEWLAAVDYQGDQEILWKIEVDEDSRFIRYFNRVDAHGVIRQKPGQTMDGGAVFGGNAYFGPNNFYNVGDASAFTVGDGPGVFTYDVEVILKDGQDTFLHQRIDGPLSEHHVSYRFPVAWDLRDGIKVYVQTQGTGSGAGSVLTQSELIVNDKGLVVPLGGLLDKGDGPTVPPLRTAPVFNTTDGNAWAVVGAGASYFTGADPSNLRGIIVPFTPAGGHAVDYNGHLFFSCLIGDATFNYLSGGHPLAVIPITGNNPRFYPIGTF
jgi:hypothetical protein